MKQLHKAWICALSFAAGFAAYDVVAATQGALGTTSTATAVITVIIPETLRITSMNDLALGTYTGTGTMTANDNICIYDNSSNGRYAVKITDSSSLSPTGFSVQNPTGNAHIPFTVMWNDQTGTAGSKSIGYNTSLNSTGANTVSTDCSTGGLSANLQVNFAAADLQAGKGGSYSTTLTVMVEP